MSADSANSLLPMLPRAPRPACRSDDLPVPCQCHWIPRAPYQRHSQYTHSTLTVPRRWAGLFDYTSSGIGSFAATALFALLLGHVRRTSPHRPDLPMPTDTGAPPLRSLSNPWLGRYSPTSPLVRLHRRAPKPPKSPLISPTSRIHLACISLASPQVSAVEAPRPSTSTADLGDHVDICYLL